MINIVDGYYRDWRMLLNLDKSKALAVPKQVKHKTAGEVIKNEIKQAVTVRGVEVPFVNEYEDHVECDHLGPTTTHQALKCRRDGRSAGWGRSRRALLLPGSCCARCATSSPVLLDPHT